MSQGSVELESVGGDHDQTDHEQKDAPAQQKDKQQHIEITWKQLIGGSLGNILEWYDFAVFGYLANSLSKNFFPSQVRSLQLIETYGVFGGAFFARPLGGILFGNLGDRYGRKLALQVSLGLMLICTFALGCLPSYSQIGVGAPILLALLRLCQGVSVGGQLVGSMLFIVESSEPSKRGYYGSIVMMTASAGTLSGSIFVACIEAAMSREDLDSWGWRIPFLCSAIIGIAGFWFQKNMEESFEFENAQKKDVIRENPLKDAVKEHSRDIVFIALVASAWCIGIYMTFVWLPNYISEELEPPFRHAVAVNCGTMFFMCIALVWGGYISDIYGYAKVMKYGSLWMSIIALPGYVFIGEFPGNGWPMALFQLVFSIGLGCVGGPLQIFMITAVDDVTLRYSVMGIAYNVSQALFGGTAPAVGESLASEHMALVGIYVAGMTFIAAILLQWKKTAIRHVRL